MTASVPARLPDPLPSPLAIRRMTGAGFQHLYTVPGEEHLTCWGSHAPGPLALDRSNVVLSFVHLTDLHVLDASSPARAEHTQLLEHDPSWRVMLPMHRPYELLVNHAVAAMVETVRQRWGDVDFALITGDCIDNAQHNELEMYLALIGGGSASMVYDGVQSPAGHVPGFWCPEPDVADDWKRLYGFPAVPGLLEAIQQPIISKGLGVPTLVVSGNHDVMRQGTAFTSSALESIAIGSRKATGMPPGFDPPDKLAAYLSDPASYNVGAPDRPVRSDVSRRMVTPDEWLAAHTARYLLPGSSPLGGTVGRGSDGVVDTERIRIITLDTNHPAGHYQGSMGAAQVAWLRERISETQKWVVLATHHGLAALTNDTRDVGLTMSAEERLLSEAVARVLHQHPNVVAWFSGHRHVNRVVHHAHPEGRTEGFWEITTSSLIDWPSQARHVKFVLSDSDELLIVCTPTDHQGPTNPSLDSDLDVWNIASLHRQLCANWGRQHAEALMAAAAGTLADQRCILLARSA
jgi:metallophosphoesterase (TIGR03767 family)